MKFNSVKCKLILTFSVAFSLVAGEARADAVTFAISDLVFAGPSGQNGLPAPISVSEPGINGHLKWTYTPGDFSNGTGTLLDLTLPITYYLLSDATISIGNTGITGTNPGNFHNLTYDWAIVFSQALTGPNQSTSVNPASSTFDFTGIYGTFNGEWIGSIIGGTISPLTGGTVPPVAGGTVPPVAGGTVPSITASVPEPSTYAMLLAGLGLLGFVTRRSKQNVA